MKSNPYEPDPITSEALETDHSCSGAWWLLGYGFVISTISVSVLFGDRIKLAVPTNSGVPRRYARYVAEPNIYDWILANIISGLATVAFGIGVIMMARSAYRLLRIRRT